MRINRRAVRVVAVLSIAAAAGHLVQQRGEAAPTQAVAQVAPAAKELPEPQNVTLVSAGPTEAPPPVRAEIATIAPTGPKMIAAPVAVPEPAPVVAEACPVQLTLIPQPNAMIGLSLLAPCHADERVVLRHAGLAVAEKTTAAGSLFAVIPALDAAGAVSLRFTDGTTASDSLAVPDLAGVQRFAVQWQDRDAFQLHGFENGADYGDPGHVWADAPNTPLPGAAATGGYLTLLGDPAATLPMLAQVYTYPAGKAEVVVEAAVTDATCGRDLLGETLVSTAGAAKVSELNVSMPDCEAKGDILVLRNLAEDMKIAAAN